jgi:hypothetical protein
MMPLNSLKNAEICTGRAKRHAGTTSTLPRLSASSAAFHKQTHTHANLHISFFVSFPRLPRPTAQNDAAENAEKR